MPAIRTLIASVALAASALVATPALADTPKATPPAAAKEVSAADAQKFIAFFNKLVDLIVATQADCPKMADGITKLIDGSPDVIAAGKKAKADGKDLPKAEKDKMEKRIKDEMVPALQKKCIGDKAVQAAMQKAAS